MTMMPHAIDIIKGEIHRVVTVLRNTSQNTVSNAAARFHREIPIENESSLLRSMRNLYAELQEENTLTNELYHDIDAVSFTKPFLDVLTTEDIPGIITSVALSSINKFLLYGFLNDPTMNNNTTTTTTTSNSSTGNHTTMPTSMHSLPTIDANIYRQPYYIVRGTVAINSIAYSTTHCRFEPSTTKEDEAILMKLLEVLGNTLRCGSSIYLTDDNIWNIIQACFRISRVEQSSHLLQRTGESTLAHVIMHVFSRAHEITQQERTIHSNDSSSSSSTIISSSLLPLSSSSPVPSNNTTPLRPPSLPALPNIHTTATVGHKTVRKPYGSPILRRVIAWLASLADPKQHGRTTRLLGLEFINIVLETGGESLGNFPGVVEVIQNDLCKSLIANSRTTDLPTLSLTLRVVFNLFASMKSHLKVQLEVFLTSVHLTLADAPSVLPEQRELALESLLEFCREPTMMLDLYVNFDCDVACANLFEALARCVCRCAVPDDHNAHTLTVLHTLAFECVVTILGTIAQRCPNHPVWQQRLNHYYTASIGNPPDDTTTTATEPFGTNDDNNNNNKSTRNVDNDSGNTHNLSTTTNGNIPMVTTTMMNNYPFSQHYGLRTPTRSNASGGGERGGDSSNTSLLQPASILPHSTPSGGTSDNNNNREQITAMLRQRRLLKRRMAMAAVRFNSDPKHWVEYAQELELLPTPADAGAVAKFFRECPGLDKTLIGLYISEPDDAKHTFHTAVRNAYVRSFNFTNLRVDEALRVFLESFRLPGEAQKIERLMQTFAEHVYTQSPGSMHHSDTVFVLSYSIIMLNTDLHNKQVRKKMTLDQFLSNNRKIDQNQDLPKEFLTAIYNSILEKEIMLRADAPMVPTVSSATRNPSSSSFGRSGSTDNLHGKDGNTNNSTGQTKGSSTPGGNNSSSNGSNNLASPQIGSEHDTNLLGNQWDGVLRRQTAVTAYTSSARMLMGTTNGLNSGIGYAGYNRNSNGTTTNGLENYEIPPGCPIPAGAHERDMFQLMAESTLTALAAVFSATRDATVLKRTALGFRDFSVLTAYYGMTKQLNALIIVLSRSIIGDMDTIGEIAEQSNANHPRDPQMETLLEYARTCARTYARTILRTTGTKPDDKGKKKDNKSNDNANERLRTKESLEILLMDDDNGNTSSPAVTPGRTRSDNDIGTPSVHSPAAIARMGPIAGNGHLRRPRGLSYVVGDSDEENEEDPSFNRRRTAPKRRSYKTNKAKDHAHSDSNQPEKKVSNLMSIDDLNDDEDKTPSVVTDTDERKSDLDGHQYDYAEDNVTPQMNDETTWITIPHQHRRKHLRQHHLYSSPGALILRRMLLGLRTLLSIVSENGSHIKEAWRNIIEVITRLGINDCLAPGFLDVDDFRSPNGMLIASVSSSIPFRNPVSAAYSLASAVTQIRENLSSATNPNGGSQTEISPIASLPVLLSGSRFLQEAVRVYNNRSKPRLNNKITSDSNNTTDDESTESNSRSGLWGTISSFFSAPRAEETNEEDVAETILTAIACEVTRTNALPVLVSKSSVLSDDTLSYLLQAIATVRDPNTLAKHLFGSSTEDETRKEMSLETETDDSSHVINATVCVEMFATIAIRNIHRINIVLPALLYYYRALLTNPASNGVSKRSNISPSRGLCFVTERIVINLLRIAIRICSVDETIVSSFGNNYSNEAYQYKDDDTFDDKASDSVPNENLENSVPFSSSNDNLCPINVAISCLRVFADIHPSVFAVVSPRISAGISLLLHVNLGISQLVPFGTKDEQGIHLLVHSSDTDEGNSLFVFFGAIFSLLNSCQPFFFACPGIWDSLCRLGSGIVTNELAQNIQSSTGVSVETKTKALRTIYRLHGRIFASMFRIGATYLNPCLRDEVVAGCAASIFLSDIHGDFSTSVTVTATETKTRSGSTSPWGRRGRERSWSGFGSKKVPKVSSSASTNVASVAVSATQGRSISSEAMQAAVAAAEAEEEALAIASTEYHSAMCTLVTDQSLSELREFIAQAILRLLEQLALAFPSSTISDPSSPPLQKNEVEFIIIQWLSSLRVLQATTIALLIPFSDAIANVASIVQGRITSLDTENVWDSILNVSLNTVNTEIFPRGSALSSIPALPFPYASLLHLPSPQEESVWLRTSSSILRLVVSTIQRLLLTNPLTTVPYNNYTLASSVQVGQLWDQVFYSILFPLQHSTIIRAMGSLPSSLATSLRRKNDNNNRGDRSTTESTINRIPSSTSTQQPSSSSSSRTLSFAAALRQAIDDDLQSTANQANTNVMITLDRAEALVQVNAILSKTILQVTNYLVPPSNTASSETNSLSFSLPYFMENLWYPTFYSFLQQYQQANNLLNQKSSSFSSSFAILTKSKATIQQEQEEHRAACQLLTESSIDDIRKLFFVLSGIHGLKDVTEIQTLSIEYSDRIVTLYLSMWKSIQTTLPNLMNELSMIVPGITMERLESGGNGTTSLTMIKNTNNNSSSSRNGTIPNTDDGTSTSAVVIAPTTSSTAVPLLLIGSSNTSSVTGTNANSSNETIPLSVSVSTLVPEPVVENTTVSSSSEAEALSLLKENIIEENYPSVLPSNTNTTVDNNITSTTKDFLPSINEGTVHQETDSVRDAETITNVIIPTTTMTITTTDSTSVTTNTNSTTTTVTGANSGGGLFSSLFRVILGDDEDTH